VSLPDGWLEVDDRRVRVIASWNHDDSVTTVSLIKSGQVEVESCADPPASFPIELAVHIQASWHRHQASRAP
jgi:hypothetical protein